MGLLQKANSVPLVQWTGLVQQAWLVPKQAAVLYLQGLA